MANQPGSEHEHGHAPVVLPANAVVELTDKLTQYMTEIEHGGLDDIMGQVLDDFLEQCGAIPEDLTSSPEVFEQITQSQLAVTLAFQLGRLEGRSPKLVETLVSQIVDKWGLRPLSEAQEISDADLKQPKERVYPRLRRMEFTSPK